MTFGVILRANGAFLTFLVFRWYSKQNSNSCYLEEVVNFLFMRFKKHFNVPKDDEFPEHSFALSTMKEQ